MRKQRCSLMNKVRLRIYTFVRTEIVTSVANCFVHYLFMGSERWSRYSRRRLDVVTDDPYPGIPSHSVLSWLYHHLRTIRLMSFALTKRIVLTAEPRDRPYELRDAQVRGLILRVLVLSSPTAMCQE